MFRFDIIDRIVPGFGSSALAARPAAPADPIWIASDLAAQTT